MHRPFAGSERTLELSEGSLASLCFLAIRKQAKLMIAYALCKWESTTCAETETAFLTTCKIATGTSKRKTYFKTDIGRCGMRSRLWDHINGQMYYVLQAVHNLNLRF